MINLEAFFGVGGSKPFLKQKPMLLYFRIHYFSMAIQAKKLNRMKKLLVSVALAGAVGLGVHGLSRIVKDSRAMARRARIEEAQRQQNLALLAGLKEKHIYKPSAFLNAGLSWKEAEMLLRLDKESIERLGAICGFYGKPYQREERLTRLPISEAFTPREQLAIARLASGMKQEDIMRTLDVLLPGMMRELEGLKREIKAHKPLISFDPRQIGHLPGNIKEAIKHRDPHLLKSDMMKLEKDEVWMDIMDRKDMNEARSFFLFAHLSNMRLGIEELLKGASPVERKRILEFLGQFQGPFNTR